MAAFAKSGDASDAPSIRYLINLTSHYRCFGCSAPDAHATVPAGSEGSALCQRAIGTRVASVFAALKRPDILSMHPPRRSLRGQTSLKLSGDGFGGRRSIRYKEGSRPTVYSEQRWPESPKRSVLLSSTGGRATRQASNPPRPVTACGDA